MMKILITGATDGIGRLAAQLLAHDGHELYLHGRNAQKLDNLIADLRSNYPAATVSGFVADFSDLAAVREMAKQASAALPHLDVLINNAGVFTSAVDRVPDLGIDIRFVVNYLAPFLLTQGLLPALRGATSPRLINLSSAAQSPVELSALRGQHGLSAQEAYAQSKLALTMWSFWLAEQEAQLTTIAVNPGSLLNTNMVRAAYGKFWSSADKGAEILHRLATGTDAIGHSGDYFDNDRGSYGPAHPDAYDSSKIEALIQLTQELLLTL